MSRAELLSMIAVTVILWWVREITGEGAVSILIEALPSLGL